MNDAFPTFSQTFEGYVPWMYLDIKGLITIGIGNLIDPESNALSLPFVDGSGLRVTPARISAEWHKLKAMPALAKQGHKACKSITELRLGERDIDALVRQRLASNEAALEKVFHGWPEWPADAQLGVLSMAWAMGSGFSSKWPRFTAACTARDWLAAAANCRMKDTDNPGLVPRNNANQRLFANAHEVVAQSLEPGRLYYPDVLHAPVRQV